MSGYVHSTRLSPFPERHRPYGKYEGVDLLDSTVEFGDPALPVSRSSVAHPTWNLFLRGGYVYILRPRTWDVKSIFKFLSETRKASWF